MLKVIVSLITALALFFSGSMVAAEPADAARKRVHKSVMLSNCEDVDTVPCITYDDGKWKRVSSYSPYRAKVVARCKSKNGGPKFPCVVAKSVNSKFRYFAK